MPNGVYYLETSSSQIYQSPSEQLYFFKVFIGKHVIEVEEGDSIYYFDDALEYAHLKKGKCSINSLHCATLIRGYMPPEASVSLKGVTVLPYINGCSTKQLFPPIRQGDPTLQYLYMPPNSSEQAHHIHSTARVVLVLSGKGQSIVGLDKHTHTEELYKGKVCILEPMCPHHFETPFGEPLVVIPLHIFSSIPQSEQNHPMYNGTYRI